MILQQFQPHPLTILKTVFQAISQEIARSTNNILTFIYIKIAKFMFESFFFDGNENIDLMFTFRSCAFIRTHRHKY